MMAKPYRAEDRELWLDLVAQGIRLTNPKVIDLGPLKKAATAVNKAMLPEEHRGALDNPFHRLMTGANKLQRNRTLDRELLISRAWNCFEAMFGEPLGMGGRDRLRTEALRGYQTFRKVLSGLCDKSNSDAA